MQTSSIEYGFSEEEWEVCLKVLETLTNDPLHNPDNTRFKTLITQIHKTAKKKLRQLDDPQVKTEQDKAKILHTKAYRDRHDYLKKENSQKDRAQTLSAIKLSEIGSLAIENTTKYDDVYCVESFSEIPRSLSCYCCNKPFKLLHHFYHRLCPDCATFNYQQRFDKEDLTGRNAVITGARVKVGYATCLKLLRQGANVIASTRFPALAIEQFMLEKDFADWQDRLWVYGLDLRNINSVEKFISFVKAQFQWCDILINNAAQTIKYPADYYAPLIHNEQLALTKYSQLASITSNTTPVCSDIKAIAYNETKVTFENNRFGQPIDNREKNSWNSGLDEISTFELIEVNLINHISPYLLIRDLKPLFLKSPNLERFIINVTSSEGQFSYANKTIFHPHTNMTKAALNMMTRTSAYDFIKDGIFMNSVDVGWISTGARESLRKKQFDAGNIPPLDSVDGAARIMHPILLGLRKQGVFGKL